MHPPAEPSGVALPVPPPPPVRPLEELFAELDATARLNRPGEDFGGLHKAFTFAVRAHAQQKRHTGEPYITHPIEVARLLAHMQMDSVCLQTALLHDTVEDTGVTLDEVRREFGPEVAHCVDGVTKLGKLDFYSREERQAESVRKMLLAMVSDIRVVLVKLADRIHNMRTLDAMTRDQQVRISQETLDIYAPIANRLGMGKVRGELEDLAFRHIEPEAYEDICRQIQSRQEANEQYLHDLKHHIQVNLAREGIHARVDGRLKRAYSIYLKLRRQKITIDQVYDLLAVRIVTDSVKNCYAALGVIHNEWHPVPGRIKDFIAIPRPNLYQSLHTSVIGPQGLSFEVQIRTEEMHRLAEDGIAAHWKYKEGRRGGNTDDQRIAWMRQLVEWQREMRDPGEFMSTLKVDLYPEEVYAFTPKGKVIVLPRDATPIDFAFSIHSDVGLSCSGAKVNGRIVPLKYTLKNGDVVEILTQQGAHPSKDWLALVRTTRARNKIKHFINATERVKAIEIGQKYLEKEARRLGVQMGRIPRQEFDRVAADYGLGRIEDLHAALGYGKFSARQVLAKAAPEQVPAAEPAPEVVKPVPSTGPKGAHDLVIRVKGVDDLLVYRAKCCNPIKGESIVGYVTRGKGVAVHSTQCANVQNLMYEVERKMEVEWARTGAAETFPVRIMIRTDDRPGMLNQFTSILSNENCNIRSLEARGDERSGGDGALVEMTVEIKDKKQLEKVVSSLRRVPGVRDVERVQ